MPTRCRSIATLDRWRRRRSQQEQDQSAEESHNTPLEHTPGTDKTAMAVLAVGMGVPPAELHEKLAARALRPPGTDKTAMDFRRLLPEMRWQSCLSPVPGTGCHAGGFFV